MNKLIGFTGFTGLAGSGKNAAADHLVINSYYNEYAFAKPIKDACKVMFNWTEEHVNGSLKEQIDTRYNVSPRQAMQTLGTEWGRNTINANLWLLRAQDEINNAMMDGKSLAITDARFDNEAQLIKDNGGIVIKIVRADIEAVAAHSSETGISDSLIDYVIKNDGSLFDLWAKIDSIILEHY